MSAAMMMRSAQAQAFSCKQSRTSVVVRAEARSSSSIMERIQLTAATLATAAILASPADAGVVIQQPKLKKLLYDEAAEQPAPRPPMELRGLTKSSPSAPATTSAPAEKKEVSEEGSGFKFDLDPFALGILALPASIGGIAAAAFVFSKVDGGFVDFVREASVRDSNNYAGYEPVLKPESGPIDFKGLNGSKKVNTKAGGQKRITTVVKKSGVPKPGVTTEGTGFSKLGTSFSKLNPFSSTEE